MNNVPIVFTFDNNWAQTPACIAISSLLENADKDTSYDIIIIHSDIKDENINIIKEQVKKYKRHSLKFIVRELANFHLEDRKLEGVKHSLDVYTRLYLPEILENYDKIIFSDVDLVFLKDISDFYETDLKNNYLGAIKDLYVNEEIESGVFKTFGKKYKNKYFNAGVLLMNLKALRKDNMVEKFEREALNKHRYQDQDILNITCFNKVKYMDTKYNLFADFVERPKKAKKFGIEKIVKNPSIIHYVGPFKPWKMKKNSQANKLWWECANKSIVETKQDYKYMLGLLIRKFKRIFWTSKVNKKGYLKIRLLRMPIYSKKVI